MSCTNVQRISDLMQMEYSEMPGLQLTFWQAQRLWNLTADVCDAALSGLLASGFLVRTRDGRYRRPHPERLSSETAAPGFRAMTA